MLENLNDIQSVLLGAIVAFLTSAGGAGFIKILFNRLSSTVSGGVTRLSAVSNKAERLLEDVGTSIVEMQSKISSELDAMKDAIDYATRKISEQNRVIEYYKNRDNVLMEIYNRLIKDLEEE